MLTQADYSRRWRKKHRAYYNQKMRAWRAANKEIVSATNKRAIAKRKASGLEWTFRRKYHLKKKYGMTLEAYHEKLTAQGGVCAICKLPETSIRRGTFKSLDVDHNHETGAIRGLLCSACNASLGLLREDPVRIEALLTYIRQWNS